LDEKHTPELFQIYQPHRLRLQKMHKEGEGERMLTEPKAHPERDVKPPVAERLCYVEKTYCWGTYPEKRDCT
jgi:hypothetical protein